MNTHKTLFKFGLKKLALLLTPFLVAGLFAAATGISANGCDGSGYCPE